MERLLFDGIDTKATRATVGREHDLIVDAGSNKTKTPLPFPEATETRADIALDPTVLETVPVLRGSHESISRQRHPRSPLRTLIIPLGPSSLPKMRHLTPVGVKAQRAMSSMRSVEECRTSSKNGYWRREGGRGRSRCEADILWSIPGLSSDGCAAGLRQGCQGGSTAWPGQEQSAGETRGSVQQGDPSCLRSY